MMPEKNLIPDPNGLSRRKFIYNVGTAVGAGAVLSMPLASNAVSFIKPAETYTVKQIMDLFISQIPGAPFANTVDTLKSGSPDIVVTGIVTTMFATIDVIRKAIDLGANFIIAHEPTFYNHSDDSSWLKNDDVYQYKADLLKQHNIAVWRNHDYIHTLKPDGVTKGVLAQLEWQKYADKDVPNILTFPAITVNDLVNHAKEKLHIEKVRFIGDPAKTCTRVLFMPGAPGGQRHIQAIGKVKPEVLICGELQEWETAEYVRDARAKGDNLTLVVLGHIASEEPGSVFMRDWLNEKVPSVKTTHLYCGNSLGFL
ncbi:MAG TPA: Nif3-like dinuclear metal center hexameric protein [Mucilaginibacter sp.]|nr:Nif3-like dinuclear metal center hexameric protein [Mucilaginibacter sp.]